MPIQDKFLNFLASIPDSRSLTEFFSNANTYVLPNQFKNFVSSVKKRTYIKVKITENVIWTLF